MTKHKILVLGKYKARNTAHRKSSPAAKSTSAPLRERKPLRKLKVTPYGAALGIL